MKAFFVLVFVFVCSSAVSALNDAFITVDSSNTDLCLSLGSIDHPVCNGDVLRVNGTSDHDLYVVSGGYGDMNFNVSDMNDTSVHSLLQAALVDPLYLALDLGGFLVFMVSIVGGGYIAFCFIAAHIPGYN